MIEYTMLYEFYWCFAFDGWVLVCHVISWHWDFYGGLIHLVFVSFYALYMIYFIGNLSYPLEAFQKGFLVFTLVFPKLRLCHPNKGCDFWVI